MDKRHAHHLWTRLRPIKAWHLLIVSAIFLAIGLFAVRQNYSHMVALRSKVYAADKAGEGVNEALQNLRNYVGHHMNTSLTAEENGVYPPIQLKYTYDRLVVARNREASAQNRKVYTAAQDYCEAKIPKGLSGSHRINCIQNYVTTHSVSASPIDPALYKFDFYSPTWAPDVAGWSLLAAALFFIVSVVLFVTRRLIHTASR